MPLHQDCSLVVLVSFISSRSLLRSAFYVHGFVFGQSVFSVSCIFRSQCLATRSGAIMVFPAIDGYIQEKGLST